MRHVKSLDDEKTRLRVLKEELERGQHDLAEIEQAIGEHQQMLADLHDKRAMLVQQVGADARRIAALEPSNVHDLGGLILDSKQLTHLARTEAVRVILEGQGGPTPRDRLLGLMHRAGWVSLTPQQLSTTLSQLKRQGQVEAPSRGNWAAVS